MPDDFMLIASKGDSCILVVDTEEGAIPYVHHSTFSILAWPVNTFRVVSNTLAHHAVPQFMKVRRQKKFFFVSGLSWIVAQRFLVFFLSPDFHQLWHSVMSICLLTEVKRQWAMLVLGWVTVWVLDQLCDVSELEFLCVPRLS